MFIIQSFDPETIRQVLGVDWQHYKPTKDGLDEPDEAWCKRFFTYPIQKELNLIFHLDEPNIVKVHRISNGTLSESINFENITSIAVYPDESVLIFESRYQTHFSRLIIMKKGTIRLHQGVPIERYTPLPKDFH